MAFAGLIIHTETLAPLTIEFLDLKRRFYPRLRTVGRLDLVLSEVKGSELRKGVRSQSRVVSDKLGKKSSSLMFKSLAP